MVLDKAGGKMEQKNPKHNGRQNHIHTVTSSQKGAGDKVGNILGNKVDDKLANKTRPMP